MISSSPVNPPDFSLLKKNVSTALNSIVSASGSSFKFTFFLYSLAGGEKVINGDVGASLLDSVRLREFYIWPSLKP